MDPDKKYMAGLHVRGRPIFRSSKSKAEFVERMIKTYGAVTDEGLKDINDLYDMFKSANGSF